MMVPLVSSAGKELYLNPQHVMYVQQGVRDDETDVTFVTGLTITIAAHVSHVMAALDGAADG